MTGKGDRTIDPGGLEEPFDRDLRRRAERKLEGTATGGPETPSPESANQVLHELRVHEIELEMQNEELRRAQEALAAQRARYFDLYDLAPVGYVTIAEDGSILEANLTAARLFGMPRGELIAEALTVSILPEDQDVYYLHCQQLFETGEPQTCELRMRRSDGTVFWARLQATLALEEEAGSPQCRTVIHDITAQKDDDDERERLRAQLAQAQKMESIGRLAGGVAHDFNNMLAVILGYVELALEHVDHADPLHADLEEIQTAARRSEDLTRQLLAFARKQVAIPRIVDLNDTVQNAMNMLRRLIGEDVDLAWQPEPNLWPIKIDPAQIDQILANLCTNARDAIRGTGRITLGTTNVALGETDGAPESLEPGAFVVLSVKDTGSGMDAETLSHLFEPFFTTKQLGHGTGLGLATVYGIVKQNDGLIDVQSDPNRGTEVRVYLRRAAVECLEDPIGAITAATGSGETILLVEDDGPVLRLGRLMLERLGYNVIAAETTDAALQAARLYRGEIHLLMTDVVMPVMDGRRLADRIQGMRPNTKCLFTSGYPADFVRDHSLVDPSMVHYLQKPFSLEDLARRVRVALDHE